MTHAKSTRRRTLGRWFRRLAILALLAFIAAAGAVAYAWQSASSVPEFYARGLPDEPARLEAVASVERKVGNLQDALGQAVAEVAVEAEEEAEEEAEAVDEPASEPLIQVEFTGAEIDAYLAKWLADSGFDRAVGRYLSAPRVAVGGGAVVVAGRAPDLRNAVVSLHFRPTVGDGEPAGLSFAGAYLGTLPLPDAATAALRDKAATAMNRRERRLRRDAALNDRGDLNSAAIQLEIARQLAALLAGETVARPVLFPPLLARGPVAARVDRLEVTEDPADSAAGTLAIGLTPLPHADRAALLADLKEEGGPAGGPPVID